MHRRFVGLVSATGPTRSVLCLLPQFDSCSCKLFVTSADTFAAASTHFWTERRCTFNDNLCVCVCVCVCMYESAHAPSACQYALFSGTAPCPLQSLHVQASRFQTSKAKRKPWGGSGPVTAQRGRVTGNTLKYKRSWQQQRPTVPL